MNLLADNWQSSFLDYARLPGQCRIKVRLWALLKPVDGIYVVPTRHWRVLYNYLREIGLRRVFRKVASRRSEGLRNQKFLAVGCGEVLESSAESNLRPGQPIVFLAPCHPKCVERISLPEAFLQPLDQGLPEWLPEGSLAFFEQAENGSSLLEGANAFAGWSPYSGSPADAAELSRVLSDAAREMERLDLSDAKLLPLSAPSPIAESKQKEFPGKAAKTAALIGYGQYAKTSIVPNLHAGVRIAKVHEIDPCQLGDIHAFPYACDTSPNLRAWEQFDVYFIAGFHHTHAPTAVEALRRGAAAVVEKPLATTFAQLDELTSAMQGPTGGRFFAGFQKRYSPLTRWAVQDLGIGPGRPVSYHCIVYEIELPPLHWYNWPNSGSRILSNGCHWIDHFLFLNGFSPVKSFEVGPAGQRSLFALAELDNGASFTMTLGDEGSPRIGMQEYVELRSGKRSVRICNFSDYRAEDELRLLRKARVNKLQSFREMYREISRRIVEGLPGDDPESVASSVGLTLQMEDRLRKTVGMRQGTP